MEDQVKPHVTLASDSRRTRTKPVQSAELLLSFKLRLCQSTILEHALYLYCLQTSSVLFQLDPIVSAILFL